MQNTADLVKTCDFSGFFRNSGFLKFICRKIHFWDSRRNEEKIRGIIVYICFIKQRRSWRRDHLFYINRTKERELFTEISRCAVSKKNEVICSANDVYCLMFMSCFLRKIRLENIKETEAKKTYYSYHYSSGYYIK